MNQNLPFPSEKTWDILMKLEIVGTFEDICSEQDYHKMSPDQQISKIEKLRDCLHYHYCHKLVHLFFDSPLSLTADPTYEEPTAEEFATFFSAFSTHKDTKPFGSLLSRICNKNYFPNTVGAFQLNNRTDAAQGPYPLVEHTLIAVEKLFQETLEKKATPDLLGEMMEKQPVVAFALTFLHNYILAYVDQFNPLQPLNLPETARAQCYSELESLHSLKERIETCFEQLVDLYYRGKELISFASKEKLSIRTGSASSYLKILADEQLFLEPVLQYIEVRIRLEGHGKWALSLVDHPKIQALPMQNTKDSVRLKMLNLMTAIKMRTYHAPERIVSCAVEVESAMQETARFLPGLSK